VVIARNGGERLIRSLRSVLALGGPVVYADSGSTDGSPQIAERLGIAVLRLDSSMPHTAARGRNAGFEYLLAHHPSLEFVQFVDGDTEIVSGWPQRAIAVLEADPTIAVLCGRLRERSRERALGRLFDIEWDGPTGEIPASGGIVMMRVGPFQSVGGFDPSVPAGEEAILCGLLRRAGHRIVRTSDEMGVHDSAINHLSQWWVRTVRVGRGWADTMSRDPATPVIQRYRPLCSSALWAAVMPMLSLAGAIAAWWFFPAILLPAAGLGAYALLLARIYRRTRRAGRSPADARLYSVFCLMAKWPHLIGMLGVRRRRPS
jgi:glycosyltransferase involved in cell wall biosynthesis